MITPDEMRQLLADRNLRVVAERAGISYATLLRFANGNHMPRAKTLIELSRYLEQK